MQKLIFVGDKSLVLKDMLKSMWEHLVSGVLAGGGRGRSQAATSGLPSPDPNTSHADRCVYLEIIHYQSHIDVYVCVLIVDRSYIIKLI